MIGPVHLLELELRWFLILLVALLGYRMLTRGISLKGLLIRKQDSKQVSPERVQLLLTTLSVSANYLSVVLHSRGSVMPDVSPGSIYAIASSSGIYASIKAFTTFRKR